MKAMRNDRGDRQLYDLVGEYADIVLPDLMTVEQEDIIPNDYAGNMGYLIFLQPVTAPKFERKPIYWIMSEVAKRLGPDIHQKHRRAHSGAVAAVSVRQNAGKDPNCRPMMS
jgi:anaerobic selenocysteine-containing dehydrogenase